MDRDRFDALTRLVAAPATRRAAFGALLGAGLAGSFLATLAGNKRRNRKGKRKQRPSAGRPVTVEAVDCLSLGRGSNVSGCNYAGEDHSGEDLSSSTMAGAIFTNGTLIDTNFSSSNLRNARFNGANLCGADLSSSQLRNADFRNADLTAADLSSSGCGGIQFNRATFFCGTKTCTGAIRNDDCPGGPPAGFCCRDVNCGPGQRCAIAGMGGGTCEAVCGSETCAADECCAGDDCAAGATWARCGANGETCQACAAGEVCAADSRSCEVCGTQVGGTVCDAFGVTNAATQCGTAESRDCFCAERADGTGSVCGGYPIGCNAGIACTSDEDCEGLGSAYCVRQGPCAISICAHATICIGSCGTDGLRAARAEEPPPGIHIIYGD